MSVINVANVCGIAHNTNATKSKVATRRCNPLHVETTRNVASFFFCKTFL